MKKPARLRLFAMLPVLMLSIMARAEAPNPATSTPKPGPQPGQYCPGMDTLYLTLEELTVTLRATLQAQENLLVLKDAATARILLTQAGATLASAAARGSGARTASLIDAIVAAKSVANARGMLLWFPNLQRTINGMVEEPAVQAAKQHVVEAEAILQGQRQGDETEALRKARQLLVCDPLDIPLQNAQTELRRLNRALIEGGTPAAEDFTRLTDLLNRALTYGLQRLQDLERQ